VTRWAGPTGEGYRVRGWVRPGTDDEIIFKSVYNEYKHFIAHITPLDIVLDLGANIGVFSMIMLLQSVAELVSIEAEEENFRLLCRNTAETALRLQPSDSVDSQRINTPTTSTTSTVNTTTVTTTWTNNTTCTISSKPPVELPCTVTKMKLLRRLMVGDLQPKDSQVLYENARGTNKGSHTCVPTLGRRIRVVENMTFSRVLELAAFTAIKIDIEGGEYYILPCELPTSVRMVIIELHLHNAKRGFREKAVRVHKNLLEQRFLSQPANAEVLRVIERTGTWHVVVFYKRDAIDVSCEENN
jgi:FkbM family methyltransferase